MRLGIVSILLFFLSTSLVSGMVCAPPSGVQTLAFHKITHASQADALLFYLEKEFEERIENDGNDGKSKSHFYFIYLASEKREFHFLNSGQSLPESSRPSGHAIGLPLHLVQRTLLI